MESKKPSSAYKYTAVGGIFNSYFFTTTTDVVYEIKFIPSTDYFTIYVDVDAEVFELTISVADNPTGGRLPNDEQVPKTIFAIFEEFFLARRHVIVFICDSTDGRGRARHRKFGHWFVNLNAKTDEMTKFDRVVVDNEERIYLSLVLGRSNPNLLRLVDLFTHMGEEGK